MEDELLLQLRNIRQINSWVEISSYFKNKNPKQCSYRYKKIWAGKEKFVWSREEDLLLLELVDRYDENFESISTHFAQKTEEEIKQRYYKIIKKINRHYINFTPEEDEQILLMYNNSFVNNITHNIILEKGILSIRRRLKLLLELKGKILSPEFDISALIPSHEKKNHGSSFEVEISLNTHSEIKIGRLPESCFYHHDYSLSSLHYNDCESLFKSTLITKSENENTNVSWRMKRVCKRSSSIDIDEFKFTGENNSEDLFCGEVNAFETSFLKAFCQDSIQVHENCYERNLDLFSCSSCNIDTLSEKKKSLESIFIKVSTLSQVMKDDFMIEKVRCTKTISPAEKECFITLYESVMKSEKELLSLLRINSPKFEINNFKEDNKSKLLKENNLLESLIRVNRLKLKLIGKVVDAL